MVRFPVRQAVTLESWVDRHRGPYFDPGEWRVSKKGNLYVRIDGYCVTTFPSRDRDGWLWSVARSAIEGPVYSRSIYDTESDARRSAAGSTIAPRIRINRFDDESAPCSVFEV